MRCICSAVAPGVCQLPSYECLTLKGSTPKPTTRAHPAAGSRSHRTVKVKWLFSAALPSSCACDM